MDGRDSKPSVSFGRSFYRYNVSAMLATATDFLVLAVLHYIFNVYYVWATAFGAMAGAVVAFFLGRNWAFLSTEGAISKQAVKFLLISSISLLLNTLGVVLFVEILNFENVMCAKFIVSFTVGIFVNFPLQRYFVYR